MYSADDTFLLFNLLFQENMTWKFMQIVPFGTVKPKKI